MHVALILAKVAVIVLGFIIVYLAYLGHVRNDSTPMLYVAVGFALISVGSVCESILIDIAGWPLFISGMTQAAIIGVGMLSVLYSLVGQA